MRRREQSDFDEEIAAHLAHEIDRLRADGLSEDEARAAALRRFGNVTASQERFYESSRWLWLDNASRDLRYGARRLRKDWVFSLSTLVLLALGIGANTAIFSVVHTVLLQPLAYPAADRIVAVEKSDADTGRTSPTVSAPDFADYQAQNSVFAAIARHQGEEMTTVVNGQPEFAHVNLVSPEFFAVFGQTAAAGRLLTAREPRAPVIVVAHDWAISHFGSAQAALGQHITVFGHAGEIIGVAAPGFRYPKDADLWIPSALVPDVPVRTAHNYLAVARLKPDVTLAVAREQLRAISERLAETYPENRRKRAALTPLQDRVTMNVRATLWVLMGAVGVVLLIACANIANLLLARATARTREVALRVALGAGRGRVIRQLLTEYLLLAAAATVAGVALAHLLLGLLVSLAPAGLPRIDEVRIDAPVLLFALTVAIVSTLFFGLVPALHASRLDLTDALKQGGAKGAVGGGAGRARVALVVAEVALSVMLLAGAGLLLRSFQLLNDVDLGFTTDHLLMTEASHPYTNEASALRAAQFHRDLLARAEALPGVARATLVKFAPFGTVAPDSSYLVEGRAAPAPGQAPPAYIQIVSPGYFDTVRARLVSGRDFSATDTPETRLVAIVNEAFAREAFPGQSPIGQRVNTGFTRTTRQWMEIVGVAADARRLDPSRPAQAELFVPAFQHPYGAREMQLMVRTHQSPETVMSALRGAARELNPEVPVRFETVDQAFAQSLSYPRFRTLLVSAFAALAALLAVVGLFSVLAYLVGQRTREFAVRLAMGAGARDLLRLVLGEGLRLAAFGILLGLGGALAAAGLLRGLVFGVSVWDPFTYAAIISLLLAATLVASLLPALRAAGVNPLVSLRHE